MNAEQQRQHKLNNTLQSLLLMAVMLGLLGLLGWSIGSHLGLIIAIGICLAVIFFGPNVSPALVLRMYKARAIAPRQAPDLYQIVIELSRRAELPQSPRLYYVATPMMNAFAVGNHDNSAVAVTTGLMQKLNARELTGVLAHEISHIRHNDMWVMNLADVISRITTALSQLGFFAIFLALFGILSFLDVVLLIIALTIATLLQLALSRTREYDADRGATELTGDPQGLASALQKLERYQGGWLERVLLPGRREPDPAVLRTHPTTEERVRRLLALTGQVLPRNPPAPIQVPRRVVSLADLPTMTMPRRPRWHLSGLWY